MDYECGFFAVNKVHCWINGHCTVCKVKNENYKPKLVGKVIRKNAEIITLFKVDGKHYPATGYNAEVFETYLHTGDESLLDKLENEMEV